MVMPINNPRVPPRQNLPPVPLKEELEEPQNRCPSNELDDFVLVDTPRSETAED